MYCLTNHTHVVLALKAYYLRHLQIFRHLHSFTTVSSSTDFVYLFL